MKLLSLRDSFVFPEKPQKGGVQGASFIKPPQLAPFNAKEQPFNSISELFTLSLTLLVVAAVRQLAWLAMQRRLMVLLTDSDLECQTLQENHLGTGLVLHWSWTPCSVPLQPCSQSGGVRQLDICQISKTHTVMSLSPSAFVSPICVKVVLPML